MKNPQLAYDLGIASQSSQELLCDLLISWRSGRMRPAVEGRCWGKPHQPLGLARSHHEIIMHGSGTWLQEADSPHALKRIKPRTTSPLDIQATFSPQVFN